MPTDAELLAALVEGFRSEEDATPEPLFWAWDQLIELVRHAPDEGLRVLVQLVRSVGDSKTALAKVGAGPLEDLLKFNGRTHLPEVIAIANREPAMKGALLMVWPDRFTEDVRKLFQAWERANLSGDS